MLEANRIILEALVPRNEGSIPVTSQIIGKVSIEAGAKIRDSIVRGPAIIGRDCRIQNAYIGPFTSLYHGVEIGRIEIEIRSCWRTARSSTSPPGSITP